MKHRGEVISGWVRIKGRVKIKGSEAKVRVSIRGEVQD